MVARSEQSIDQGDDMQALMLAAGMGKRLGKFTNNNTKCMVEVAGEKLIDRAIEAVIEAEIKKMIIVVGYKGDALIDYIKENYHDSKIEFVFINNKDYAVSNNIYSFYLAKEYVINEDTLLMESDLIYDKSLLKKMVLCKQKNVAAVAKYKSWMDGTVVTCDQQGYITQFIDKAEMNYELLEEYYKTVNIYKLSKEFSRNVYIPFLEAYMRAYGLNSYYETPLKVVAHLAKTRLFAYELGDMPWYEIDDAQDLDIANVMFSCGKQKYDLVISKFGGYWRYESMLDFCYLVNPYFPTKKFVQKMQYEFPKLLGAYPSGLNMQNMNAERIFGVDKEHILVGNGASELINAIGETFRGRVAVGVPTFNEYVRCFRNCEIIYIDNSRWDYQFNLDEYKKICEEVDMLCVVSPDNPSGTMLTKEQALELSMYAKEKGTRLLLDESFIDFAESDKKYTLMNEEILTQYDNLIVIKSIGKSYGVAGLRLGVLASSDKQLLSTIRTNMQIWNINSFAEYYLQIYNLYAADYASACEKIANERKRMLDRLNLVNGIKAYESQANYIMIDLGARSSYEFCVECLENHNMLIKDLSSKNFFKGRNFIRVAIKDRRENDIFLKTIEEMLQ